MHKIICSIVLMLGMTGATLPVYANTLTQSLTRCDTTFFSEIYHQRTTLSRVAPLTVDQQFHAWFKAPVDGNGIVWFAQPLHELNLTLAGYFLQTSNLNEINYGKYYYWGLIFKESPEEVMSKLDHLTWGKAGDDYLSQAMIKVDPNSAWRENAQAVSGIAPAKESTEKLLMLSKGKEGTLLLCSVQGNVTPDMLATLRPDLTGGVAK
ncbi:Uncharacterised protein [Yersinia frederiksenii]|uniref:hypothetical protein n=1 Tax=Yersinia TaxID=629 RepID=UPI0005E08A38|nr:MULTISPECIES: hypothetical protein [Yersinia]OWF74512.1 hypothetical protein B4903_20920 [Yersinia frederiksenii]CNC75426.1 Uncharacterised protein [Yersinia frederiksenii]CNH33575.1 Uncharacterised protein [Yersinia frederiksenii]CNH66126.1 Uncharacterised protein [Yersinia frederiksenii]CNI39582.1 Uncharacterised protein [Yersinia rohdei]